MKKFRRLSLALAAFAGLIAIQLSAQSSENRHMRIINRASTSIRYLYASNVDTDRWETDLLGPFRVILPDHYVDANIDDGTGHCLYDFRAVLMDGREAVTRNVNVCTSASWTVSD